MLPSPSRISELIALVQQGRSPFELVYQSHSHWPVPKALIKRDPPRSDPDNTQRHDACKAPRILRVSILDSSFNPPTCAHLALARSKPTLRMNASFSDQHTVLDSRSEHITINENAQSHHNSFAFAEDGGYDARLLLLSVRNVDKTLKAGDATYEQRIEMMYALARELEGSTGLRAVLDLSPAAEPNVVDSSVNVAVGIINEPTFVKKAEVLHSFLYSRISSFLSDAARRQAAVGLGQQVPNWGVQPSFLMGYDTLERLVAPRYYAPSSTSTSPAQTSMNPSTMQVSVKSEGVSRDAPTEAMHAALREFFFGNSADTTNGAPFRSAVVCAHRNPSSFVEHASSSTTEDASADPTKAPSAALSMALIHAQPYIDAGCVTFIELTAEEAAMSSSEVRRRVRQEGEARTSKVQLDDGSGGSGYSNEWRRMVCGQIARYIEENGLYTASALS